MRTSWLLLIGAVVAGCGPSKPPIPTDPEAIKQEIQKEKEIRQGLEGGPPPKAELKK
jgi:hypothetical protein